VIYSYCRVKKCSNKTTVLAGHRKERRTMASVRDAEETLNLLKDFSDEILTEAEKKGLTRYEVWKLPKVLESTIRRENFQNEKPYKRNPQP